MSSYLQFLENQLSTTLQVLLTQALTGPFRSADYAAQFATQFAPPVAAAITEDAFNRSAQISKTAFMIGIALATHLFSLGVLFFAYRRQPKSIRNNLLLISILSGVISDSIVGSLLVGDEIGLKFPAISIPLFVAFSIMSVLLSALWQTPELWDEPYKSMYRWLSVAVCITSIVSSIYYFSRSQLDCPARRPCTLNRSYANLYIALSCVVQYNWISTITIGFYVIMYLAPFAYTLRKHIAGQRRAGITKKTAINDVRYSEY